MAYVYRHVRLDTNMPFYIGVGSDSKGWYNRSRNKSNRSKEWKQIGLNMAYRIDIILDEVDYATALKKEMEFILLYGRGALVNKTMGGYGCVGLKMSPERKEAIRKANLGKKHTPEQKKANSERAKLWWSTYGKGYVTSEEARKKLSILNTGKKHSDETKRKLSEVQKGRKRNPEAVQKTADFNRGKKRPPELMKMIAEKRKGFKHSEETKDYFKYKWASKTPEQRLQMLGGRNNEVDIFRSDDNSYVDHFHSVDTASKELKVSRTALVNKSTKIAIRKLNCPYYYKLTARA